MNVFEYITTMPPATLDALFTDPWTVQAIFRSLPPLAKNYVLRLLFADADVPVSLIQAWVKPQGASQHKTAMKRLLELKIFTEKEKDSFMSYSAPKAGEKLISMNKYFREALQQAMCDNLDAPWKSTLKPDKRAPTLEQLEKYTKKRWESILHFMIGAPISERDKPSPKVVSLLVSMGLMQIEGDDTLRITDKGFRFLMQDIYTQVWTFLLAYIESVQEQQTDLKAILSFLFQLSFLTLGKDYPVPVLTESQKTLLMDLKEFGLIFQRKGKQKESRRYYPTRLALSLASGKEYVLSSSSESKGYIIVGTDYRLYAYTNSTLNILLLSLFTKLQYRLPNLVVGTITRESIRTALINGISAQQILDFLEKNAHPQLRKAAVGLEMAMIPGADPSRMDSSSLNKGGSAPSYLPIVPETVADEIRLWEADRNRVSYQAGVLYDHFPSAEAFEKVTKYAQDLGVYIWSNRQKQYLMVTEKGHEDMRNFIKKNIS